MTVSEMLEKLLSELGNGSRFPCSQVEGDKPCTLKHEGKTDKNGRTVFYFASDCKIAQTFCASCLAYWHVAVARNCIEREPNLNRAARKEPEELDFQPLRIAASVAIGLAMDKQGRIPTAAEMVKFTQENPHLFPKPWTRKQAQFCLDNPNHLLGTEG